MRRAVLQVLLGVAAGYAVNLEGLFGLGAAQAVAAVVGALLCWGLFSRSRR